MSRMIIPFGYSGDRADDPDVVTDALKGFVAFWGGKNEEYRHLKGSEYRQAYAHAMRKWAARNGHADLFEKMSDGGGTSQARLSEGACGLGHRALAGCRAHSQSAPGHPLAGL